MFFSRLLRTCRPLEFLRLVRSAHLTNVLFKQTLNVKMMSCRLPSIPVEFENV